MPEAILKLLQCTQSNVGIMGIMQCSVQTSNLKFEYNMNSKHTRTDNWHVATACKT